MMLKFSKRCDDVIFKSALIEQHRNRPHKFIFRQSDIISGTAGAETASGKIAAQASSGTVAQTSSGTVDA